MINYIKKDVTTVEKGIVGHGVNCQGKMGSGVAKAIRAKWPEVYNKYAQYSSVGAEMLGSAHLISVGQDLYVANMYTQVDYGYDGEKYAYPHAIAQTLEFVANMASIYGIPVYVPKIGCGLGGLDWFYEVESIFEFVANKYPEVEINVCEL